MIINMSYDQLFSNLMFHLKEKYPQRLMELEGLEQTDIHAFSKHFFTTKTTTADASVDENSNVDNITNISYQVEFPKPLFRLNSYFILWKKLKQLYSLEKANDIIEKAIRGDIYINDQHGIAGGFAYCFNYSTNDIRCNGLPMVTKIKSVAPKYLYSFKSQVEQFTIIAANSTLGATGLADMLLVMSSYIEKILETGHDANFYFPGWFTSSEEDRYADGEKIIKTAPHKKKLFEKAVWQYVQENIVSMIYTLNQPARGQQSPFTNVSVYDKYFLESLLPDYAFDGKEIDIDIVMKTQELFLDIMNKELERTPVTFPVTTACFVVDENKKPKDKEFLRKICEKNLKFGFINFYFGPVTALSSCCRLRSNIIAEETIEPVGQPQLYNNSFGGGSVKVGSLGVVTINMPRLAYRNAGNEERFFEELSELVNDCARVNHAKRKIIEKRIEGGYLPLYSLGFMTTAKQYSTVGINGTYELCKIMGYDIVNQIEGQDFLKRVLETINDLNKKNAKQYGTLHNLEQIPAENVSVKLAEKDKILKFQTEEHQYDIYANQFIPLTTECDMLDRIRLQGMFEQYFDGGSVLHLNIDQPITDVDKMVELFEYCAEAGCIYLAVNYVMNQCEKGHMTVGAHFDTCACGAKIKSQFSRVVGYLVKTSSWNKTRREKDFPNRVFY